MKSGVSVALCALLACVISTACKPEALRTQIMAIVDADERVQASASSLHIQVYGRANDKAVWEKVAFDEVTEPLPTFPFRVALVPKHGEEARQFRVVAEAKGASGYTVRAQVIGGFQPGKTLAVQLYLDDRCNRVSCDEADQTCRAGECLPALVGAAGLHPYHPGDVHHMPGAGDASSPTDDAGSGDAGSDAQVPEGDAGKSCVADTVTCSADMLTSCDEKGHASTKPCALGCAASGKACNACAPDSNVCKDGALTACGSDGVISHMETCKDGCHPDGDRCQINDCTPSTTSCVGSQLVKCDTNGKVLSDDVCDNGCDAEAKACYECVPSKSRCADDALVVCDEHGHVTSNDTCNLGCASARCLDIAPSNELEDQVAALPGAPVVSLTGGATIDTNTGSVLNGDGSNVAIPNDALTFGSTPVRVFRVSSIQIENVRVTGTPAIVIVSDGPIVITGLFDVSSDLISNGTQVYGPGGLNWDKSTADTDSNPPVIDDPCMGGNVIYMSAGWGGGGGGGGASAGATGGMGAAVGAAGGKAHGTPELIPLVGGCRGGHATLANGTGELATPGAGGGAVQLVSRTSITVAGNIDAGGSGGSNGGFADPKVWGGAGGGSGGGILLEAPSVELTGLIASITANGGGGSSGGGAVPGGGSSCAGVFGKDGRRDDAVAAGGAQCAPVSGAGGNGAAGSTAPDIGKNSTQQGGGGGGAVGRIRVNTLHGFSIKNGAKVSPAASQGTLGTR